MIGQANECLNPPEDLQNYKCEDRGIKMYRPKYDTVTGTFQGLCETLGYIMVRGDSQEHFLDYGYSKQNPKILHSHYKKRIPSSFSGTFFNRHRIQYESGALQTTYSNVYYFLPSTTDRVDETNIHMGFINLLPIDIPEKTFEAEDNVQSDPSKLDYECPEKEKITRAVVKMLKKIIDISNANLVKYADGLLSKLNVNEEVDGSAKTKSVCLMADIRCPINFFSC